MTTTHVLVPVEPTKEMIEACCKLKLKRLLALGENNKGVEPGVLEEWTVMLAAAPKVEQEPMAVAKKGFKLEWCWPRYGLGPDGKELPNGTKLYLAPHSTQIPQEWKDAVEKAIRVLNLYEMLGTRDDEDDLVTEALAALRELVKEK